MKEEEIKTDYLREWKRLNIKLLTAETRLSQMIDELTYIATDRDAIELDRSIQYEKMYIERLRNVMKSYGDKLRKFADRYDDKELEVFVLMYCYQKKHYQICQTTGLTSQTIYNYKNKFTKDLEEIDITNML